MAEVKWLDRVLMASQHLALCCSEEEYLAAAAHLQVKYLDPWITKGASATTHTFDCDDGKTTCLVCINFEEAQKNKDYVVFGMLVHEAVHIFQGLCRDIGEKNPSSEFEAYSIQCIAQTLIEDFLRRKPTFKENEDGSSSRSVQGGAGCDPEQPEH